MRILLVGYGKMGKTIEGLAVKAGHEIAGIIDERNASELNDLSKFTPDVAIEFTNPTAVIDNLICLSTQKIPVVSGTTGWLHKWDAVTEKVLSMGSALFYASNYSIGMNIFFHINERLAKLMNGRSYDISIEETHHLQKLDSPSGTAITLAEGIIDNHNAYERWMEADTSAPILPIKAIRRKGVFGMHEIQYKSTIDTIQINHEAHSRDGFASGALTAAEWMLGRKGIFGMKDLLDL